MANTRSFDGSSSEDDSAFFLYQRLDSNGHSIENDAILIPRVEVSRFFRVQRPPSQHQQNSLASRCFRVSNDNSNSSTGKSKVTHRSSPKLADPSISNASTFQVTEGVESFRKVVASGLETFTKNEEAEPVEYTALDKSFGFRSSVSHHDHPESDVDTALEPCESDLSTRTDHCSCDNEHKMKEVRFAPSPSRSVERVESDHFDVSDDETAPKCQTPHTRKSQLPTKLYVPDREVEGSHDDFNGSMPSKKQKKLKRRIKDKEVPQENNEESPQCSPSNQEIDSSPIFLFIGNPVFISSSNITDAVIKTVGDANIGNNWLPPPIGAPTAATIVDRPPPGA